MAGGLLEALRGLVETRVDRDGQSAALEPSSIPAYSLTPAGASPRARGQNVPREVLERSLAQKILHGWLQNRLQVLVPLTFRLARLEAGDVDIVMRFAAMAMLNASSADAAAQHSLERALQQAGAQEAAIGTFRQAATAPVALSALIHAVRERHLEPYAYMATVAAADLRDTAGHMFASYVAARLALPAEAVRSINRRYRR